ncbi:MAG: DUF167 domain-containing protein [Candidatus Goldiibacteriota bacterium]
MEGLEIRGSREKFFFNVRAVPNAKKNEIAGIYNGGLKIKTTAAPENGKANEEIKAFLMKKTGLKKNHIEIVKGLKSRDKVMAVEGLSADIFLKKLEDGNA